VNQSGSYADIADTLVTAGVASDAAEYQLTR
jgi:hypothetical protein